MMQLATSRQDWLGQLRSMVDARLAAHFADKRSRAVGLAPEALELVVAIEALTMRGGKRLRPALAYAGYFAVTEEVSGAIVDVGAALELLQTYLLIHDDWMDADEERRGGPAAHVALGKNRTPHLGASLAILAGNLASAHAWELIHQVACPPRRRRALVDVFVAIHEEVVVGQQLDLLGSERVSLMHQLKTGSYTVRGPLLLGAALGGANAAQRAALDAYGAPLGEAFQLRDDILGTFGNRAMLGKPIGADLRAGKRNALVQAAEELASAKEREAIAGVFGEGDADERALDRASEALVSCGARTVVEARAEALLDHAKNALRDAPLHPHGVAMLRELADRLTFREQ